MRPAPLVGTQTPARVRKPQPRPPWASLGGLLSLASSATEHAAMHLHHAHGAVLPEHANLAVAANASGCRSAQGLELSALFDDGMVLGRHEARVFGWAPPNSTVEVRLAAPVVSAWHAMRPAHAVVDTEGAWLAHLGNLAPGGPFTMQVVGSGCLLERQLMVGDVWVFAGQSNAEYSLGRMIREANITVGAHDVDAWRARAEAELAQTSPNEIRILRLNKAWSDAPAPRLNLTHSWQPVDAAVRANDSISGILFAEKLFARHGVPIGIVQLTAGGTYLREWLPAETLARIAPLPIGGHPPAVLDRSSQIYAGMVAPLEGLSAAGLVWGHAESDIESGDHAPFLALQQEMFATLRSLFAAPHLPIVTVQVADWLRDWRQHARPNISRPIATQWVREAQTLGVQQDPHGALVVTVDLSNRHSVHYIDKWEVAHRAAQAAGRLVYGEHHAPLSPTFAGFERQDNELTVHLHHAASGICAVERRQSSSTRCNPELPLVGIEIAGHEGTWLPADVSIDKNRLTLSHANLTQPRHARYAWVPFAEANLFSTDGLPVSPWRTDNAPEPDPCTDASVRSARWFCPAAP